MFEFDIEDFMTDLEGLTIKEKMDKLDSLSSDLEDALEAALGDVDYAKQTLIDDYEKSVNNPLFASISEFIEKNHWEDLVTEQNKCFIVNSKPTSVRINTHWNQWDQWVIEIKPTEFIASNAKRHEALASLAERLNVLYGCGEGVIVKVDENELQPTIIRIITTLCKSVNNSLFASVSELIKKKHWEDLVTINTFDNLIVNSKPISVRISIRWNQWDQWIITINNTEFITSNAKRHEALASLAERLNVLYQQGKDSIEVSVEENNLQPIIERIITTLCENLENKDMADNKIKLKTIGELLGIKFFIPSYQRGYRWSEQQVTDLLNDIEQFQNRSNSKMDFYCLQPLVVKESIDNKDLKSLPKESDTEKDILGVTRNAIDEHTKWEVIDGQQRLTTIFLILSYLKNDKPYSISYQTRQKYTDFLNQIKDISIQDVDSSNPKQFITNKFAEIIKNDKSYDNIDFYHVLQTYITIKIWFSKKSINEQLYWEVLVHRVKFIWYETVDDDPIKVFTRLNIGKISLTNAELIKALFLNQSNFPDSDKNSLKLKQQEIASEWDSIEYTLQNDEFWLFLHENGYDRPTRIDFIFDLICEQNSMKLETEKYETIGTDGYRTFRFFYEYFKQDVSEQENTQDSKQKTKIESCWNEVKKYFQTFQEWFNDLEMYHYVGVLLSDDFRKKNRRLSNIVKKWTGSKYEFLKFLKNEITEEIKIPDGKFFCDEKHIEESLQYSDKKLIRMILLMHNIQTIINQNNQLIEKDDYHLPVFYKFPFHLFKKESWDVEHIDSNSENDMTDKDSRNEFLLNIYHSVDDETQKKIEAFINDPNADNWNDFIKYTKKAEDSLSDEEKNLIWNLTLLDFSTNRSYGNSIFAAKRRIIIGKDRGMALPIPKIKKEKSQSKLCIGEETKAKTAFIPPCTKNVFLKYYSSVLTNYNYWTKTDADAYKQNLLHILKDFGVTNSSNNQILEINEQQ